MCALVTGVQTCALPISQLVAMAARQNDGTLCGGVGDVLLHLFHRRRIDERPDLRSVVKPVAHLQRARPFGELCDKGVMDARLHIAAIGADAGLAAVAIFRSEEHTSELQSLLRIS